MTDNNQPEIEIYTLTWCPYCTKAKSFLKSKGFSYQEYNIEDSSVKREMLDRTDGAKTVPQIFIDDQLVGGYDAMMEMKNNGQLDDLLDVDFSKNFNQLWDIVVIGSGPAGLNTALYGARKGLDVLILSAALGGQMIDTGEVDNYLGISEAQGPDLLESFWEHAANYDVSLELGAEVTNVEQKDSGELLVETKGGQQVEARSIAVASGTTNRELGVPGEQDLRGKGVHYCATCDGYMYEGQPVAIIGGGNAGLEAALDLARLGCPVDLVEVQSELTGDQVLIDKVDKHDSIIVHTATGVKEITGDSKKEQVDQLIVEDKETGEQAELNVDGVFIEIGLLPNSDFIEDTVEVNQLGEIVINENNETSQEGIWAAGDVTDIKDKQIIIAAAEGAKTALRINEYLE
ncbi:MAG: glutaredoxin 3 [Bacillota bacterium]